MQELPKQYNPKETEGRIYEMWEKSGAFKPTTPSTLHLKPFVMAIPPPNVTGSLHMGHALNTIVQDILARWHRMKGEPVLWVPGTDHAGIATQNVVEKALAKEGKDRFDLGREEFVKKVWAWKEQYGHIIIDQLKKIGASCDWSRQRFTMDDDYTLAVNTAFKHYYEKGWVYQGERVINWCPRCATALSDIELEFKEKTGQLWFIKYKIKDEDKEITVATTRPETMLGDTAVAVNPKDERYQPLVDKIAILPIANREIPIISDESVSREFGTGAVKVTPAHDINDFDIGQRHHLPIIKVIDEEAKMSKDAGEAFAGLDRLEARKKVIAKLTDLEALEKVEDYTNSIPYCYRCGEIIEPLLSKQWFVKMKDLAKPAIEAVKSGQVKFVPSRFEKVYLDWMKNLKDWCISRQIWWGHRLPVWQSGKKEIYVGDEPPEGYTQVEDVLDTWFSSALWPFAILGWPKKTEDLQQYYPTTLLTTARDIIYLWVPRMIFSSIEFMGKIPFETVYIHPTVFNIEGKRMSKSLGTGVDPLALIETYGVDATRFGIMAQNTGVQDIKFGEDDLLAGQKFANKIWNASRFVMMKLDQTKGPWLFKAVTKDDEHVLNELAKIITSTDENLTKLRFGQTANDLYHFFWHTFCDIYLEAAKKQIADPKLQSNTQAILGYVLETSLKLLHPFMPYVTEEIWSQLATGEKPLIISQWPSKK